MKTVLIVDDSTMMRRIVGRAVSMGDEVEILEAENGQIALERLQSTPVDVLITDLNMPVMGGEELLTVLSTWQDRPEFVVVITSTATTLRKLKLTRLGVDRVMEKPFQPERLFLELQSYLEDEPEGLDDAHAAMLDVALGDTLTQMLFRIAEPCEVSLAQDEPHLAAEVVFTGAWEGTLGIVVGEAWCAQIGEELSLDVSPQDLAGELVNIVGGMILSNLEARAQEQIGLLPPFVDHWDDTPVDRTYQLDDQSVIGVQWALRPATPVEA